MMIEMVLWTVGLVSVAIMASRVIAREQPTAVQEEAPAPRSPLLRPHYVPRRPQHFALPPVTIETLPIDFKRVPEIVPPIDRGVLAALVASSRPGADAPRPDTFARGSIPPGSDYASVIQAAASDVDTYAHHSDLDGAETLRQASDLDEDAMTRTHMSPVR